jgi:3-hydroxyisobutyrate dehydrogenase-like beta-hydroxyacid dehydrogenase
LSPDLTEGIPLCRTIQEAAQADVCLLMLLDSTAVDAVLEEMEPHLKAGQVVMDMSSSDPTHSTEHAQRLVSKGIGWIDAPVSGGPEGAAAGTLAIMAGGAASDFETVKPVLEILGGNVVHVGGPGMGHVVKVINQVIVGLTIQAVAEALTLAEKSGVDPRLVQQALKGGFADSKILQIHGTRMIERSYVPGGKATIQLKDLRLGQELATTAGVRLPHLESLIRFYERLISQKDGDLDHSAIHKLLWA